MRVTTKNWMQFIDVTMPVTTKKGKEKEMMQEKYSRDDRNYKQRFVDNFNVKNSQSSRERKGK